MTYPVHLEAHLRWIDRLTAEVLRNAPPPGPVGDEFRSDLAGPLATAYFAAYECCIKAIFVQFAMKRHKILAASTGFHFDRLNGKIHWNTIADQYAKQFGETYKNKFLDELNKIETKILASKKVSVKKGYENILTWRNAFAHEGKKLCSLDEVVNTEPVSREIITLIDSVMKPPK